MSLFFYLIAVFIYLCAFGFGIYVVVEMSIKSSQPRKKRVIEDKVKFPVIIREKHEEDTIGYIDPEEKFFFDEKPEPFRSAKDIAKEWLTENSDFVTEMTKPSYKERKVNFFINQTPEVKQEIIMLLMEIYPMLIDRAGVSDTGEIILQLNN